MSEADLPLNQSPDEAAIPEYEAGVAQPLTHISHTGDDDWETVNFPDAIAIDQIPLVTESPENASVRAEGTAPQIATGGINELEGSAETPLIKALHACNRDLIDRIAELSEQLEDCHQQLREHKSNSDQQLQELDFTRAQVNRLFKKLDVANRVIRQQQVLVENLTEQWDTSQTRMAQMERECAMTRQGYNEQSHELVRVQNTCRELRSRLQRQQRYTLEFKAALDMMKEIRQSAVSPNPELIVDSPSPEVNCTDDEVSSPSFVIDSQTMNLSKASPVQPWSAQFAQQGSSVEESDELTTPTQGDDNPTPVMPPLLSTKEGLGSQGESPKSDVSDSEAIAPPPSTEISIESIVPPGEPVLEEWPKPRLVDEELQRIRLEYAAPEPVEESVANPQLAGVGSGPNGDNWPAPLIYPQHRRKLESWSAIQLPTFPNKKVEEAVEF
ncbi:MAG: hypothetical protein P5702_02875 [Limnospira sp. PMC 1291.21]|uniref:Uncharacterized protein n=2 Tax=Limnospira TaxID=2596745 RepID=B5W9T1_LIMMA|nr:MULTISPECIES: hypothetical protein [Limnospira]EKD08203.1 hypothetical protein SPLC1_S271250 [Arthrospira platensis C1]MDC0837899.1 hypothetical protein [Limnoraphis robusta]MDY7052396.1 hypothetical protein [Limnospira fusiformis LS22]QJB25254.1 hypothetical protein HFV01_04870 [Limnospira fusiformis SAG 85.79]EDZ91723.1 hypothetical protein AmaxDRAFT_5531 [Limnospira maxima CS-328]